MKREAGRFSSSVEYPIPCGICDRPLVPKHWKNDDRYKYKEYFALASNGLCDRCASKMRRDRQKDEKMTGKLTFPVRCAGECGRLMRPPGTKQEEYPDTEVAHAGKGLCTKCYTREYVQRRKAENPPSDAQNGTQDGPGAPQDTVRGRRSPYTTPLKPELWTLNGKCGDEPDLFFEKKTVSDAKKICQTCPVRRQCAILGTENEEQYGVWGGLTVRTMRKIRKGTLTLDEALNGKRVSHKDLESQQEPQHELVGVS